VTAKGSHWARKRALLAEQLKGLGHLSDSAAAQLLGRSPKSVQLARREHGLPSPPANQAKSRAARAQWVRVRAELAAQLEAEGLGHLSDHAAARALGRDATSIRLARQEAAQARQHEEARRQQAAASAPVPPVVRSSNSRAPIEARRRRIQERIDRGEYVPRWTCQGCGGQVRWVGKPPGWHGLPGRDLACPSCRVELDGGGPGG
jgi:hypothetical protein